MKRSEMINALEHRLSEIHYAEAVNEVKFEDEVIAKKLLDFIEELGMLPPCRPWDDSLVSMEEAFCWEPENEKK